MSSNKPVELSPEADERTLRPTPLGGKAIKNPEFCRCLLAEERPSNAAGRCCGCAFGQCQLGMIF